MGQHEYSKSMRYSNGSTKYIRKPYDPMSCISCAKAPQSYIVFFLCILSIVHVTFFISWPHRSLRSIFFLTCKTMWGPLVIFLDAFWKVPYVADGLFILSLSLPWVHYIFSERASFSTPDKTMWFPLPLSALRWCAVFIMYIRDALMCPKRLVPCSMIHNNAILPFFFW